MDDTTQTGVTGVKLTLRNLRHRAGAFELALDATFSGAVTGLFGPSGAGKTTLIEIIAGLRRLHAGAVMLHDQVLDDAARGIHIPPERRRIGYVPQDAALFPHLSVDANIRYGAREGADVDRVCTLLELGPLRGRGVAGLSGGERQRVAIARALVTMPRLLLLDEPLASLDRARKETILPHLRRVRDALGVPIIYVSHALPEVMALCDELVVLDAGRVLQAGPTHEVLRRPADARVAQLVGVDTILPAVVEAAADQLATLAVGSVRLAALAPELPPGTRDVLVSIRAEDVILLKDTAPPQTSARNRLAAVVRTITPQGATLRIELDCGFPLVVVLTRQSVDELDLAPGRSVLALIKAPNVHVIPIG